MNDWNIQARAHACQECEAGFADQQPYHTLLLASGPEMERRDVCEACWTGKFRGDFKQREGFLSHWQGIYELPPPAPPEAIQKDTAEGLLRRLMELNEPRYRAASYILAVMLERKRILKVKAETEDDGRRVFVYEQPKSGDLFTIPDPELQLDQLDAVQRQVAQLLEHGIETDAPPPMPASTATEADQPPAGELAETVGR